MIQLSAACGCNTGRVRTNNEDNFYFDGACLPVNNRALSGCVSKKVPLGSETCFAVFDGMGGEEFGEEASFAAAETMRSQMDLRKRYAVGSRVLLQKICAEMNRAVCDRQKKLYVTRMGTTAAILLFVPDEVYACNLGDSRIYRLRDNELLQVSVDDTEKLPEGVSRKAGLTQFLGIPEDELSLEPHIVKSELKRGDIYLICSDGLTDMLTNVEICMILREHISIRQCAQHLIAGALKNGGKDNVTAIIIRVE